MVTTFTITVIYTIFLTLSLSFNIWHICQIAKLRGEKKSSEQSKQAEPDEVLTESQIDDIHKGL